MPENVVSIKLGTNKYSLTLLECYFGYFSFDKNSKKDGTISFFICMDEPPKPPETVSSNFRDFISGVNDNSCNTHLLVFTAVQLLQHPFITESLATPSSLME